MLKLPLRYCTIEDMKIAFLLGVILFCPMALYPQEIELNQEQTTYLNRHKLTIEIKETSATAYGIQEKYRKWIAFRGFSRISEVDLFEITGYEYEAEQARKYHRQKNLLIILGTTTTIAGLGGLLVYGLAADGSNGGVIIGLSGITLAGSIPLGIGVTRAVKNWAPIGLVQDIAREYNQKLKNKILSK